MVQIGERSSDLSQIAANANNIPLDSVDCGIRSLGWCRGATCQKYARLRVFAIVLACAGLFQGACETYFRICAKQAALENGYDPIIVEWLIVSSGLFQAVFALVFAYWSDKLHPISWLSGSIILQGTVCVIAVIPSMINFSDGVRSSMETMSSTVCNLFVDAGLSARLSEEQNHILTLIMLFVLQFALGLGSLAFYVIGITYIDDNSPSIDSPAVIATTYGGKMLGLQFGSAIVLGVGATSIGWWLGWVILAPFVILTGILLGLFPKRLPKTVIHQAAQKILEESRNHHFGSQISTYIDDTDFMPSIKRLFNNKLLMFNLLGLMFIQSAVINYFLQEEEYLQSRFYLPYNENDGLMQELKANYLSFFLKPPIYAIGMLLGGLIIAKLKLSGRTIAGLNIGMGLKLLLIYVAMIFVNCNVGPIAGINGGKLQQPFCSKQCICAPTIFSPVCPENSTITYFSPCYAGCAVKTKINNIELYEDCSCGGNHDSTSWSKIRATEGACSSNSCSKMVIVFQTLSLMGTGIMGMLLIGKIIITIRSVLPQDKSLSLAMEVMLIGLFTYVPVHLAYDTVTRTTCIDWAPNYTHCLLRETPKHGNILNILSASLVFVGIIFDVLVFIYAKGLNLYNCKVTDVNYTSSLYTAVPHEERDQTMTHYPLIQGGSPATIITTDTASQQQSNEIDSIAQQQETEIAHSAPNHQINVFRNPSSLTSSSAGENSIDPNSGITYAQVVFPPDKRKLNDGTTSPKRMAVRADVPIHHLSANDVRGQLENLKSFGNKTNENKNGIKAESDLDAIEQINPKIPQSPETDF